MERGIIKIDEEKCTGCGLCVPNCPEGAIQIIDEKARLISDLFCDGLGACIGHCPEDAITIEKREAEPYDEKRVMENIITQGENVIKAHLKHLKDHGEMGYLKEALEVVKDKAQVPARIIKSSINLSKATFLKTGQLIGDSSKKLYDSTLKITSASVDVGVSKLRNVFNRRKWKKDS